MNEQFHLDLRCIHMLIADASSYIASQGIDQPLAALYAAHAPGLIVCTPLARGQSAQAAAALKDGIYVGAAANAYYGEVQVQANIQNGQLVSVKVLKYPNDRNTSRYINSQAIPLLQQESISAQSGHVDVISGATLTSEAFMQSLSDALSQAAGSGSTTPAGAAA